MTGTVGARVKALRERKGLSQAELVAGLPVAHSYVSLIERDRRKPSDRILSVIAERLGCTVEYLLTGRRGPGAQELDLELRFAELALRSGDPGSPATGSRRCCGTPSPPIWRTSPTTPAGA